MNILIVELGTLDERLQIPRWRQLVEIGHIHLDLTKLFDPAASVRLWESLPCRD